MAAESVGTWCDGDGSVGVEQRAAAPTGAPGMDGKAWEVVEGRTAPCPTLSLQGKGDRDPATGKLTFLCCMCMVWVVFVCFSIGQETGQAVRGEHKVPVLPECKLLSQYEWAESYPLCIRESEPMVHAEYLSQP